MYQVVWSASFWDRLVGLVVKASASTAEDPGFESRLRRDFSGVESYQWLSDLKNGTPVATLPGAWHYRVSAGTGRPGVSILWLGEVESWICNFYLSVTARKIVWANPSLRYTSMLLGREATNQQNKTASFCRLPSLYTRQRRTVSLSGMDVISIFKFRMMFTWAKNAEKSIYHGRELSGYRENWVNPYATLGDKGRQHGFTAAGDLLVWGLVSEASWTTIAIKAQPSTSSQPPASRQYSLTYAVSVILNDSQPVNQFTADSDSGEEIDARVESSFSPGDTTDSYPTGSLSASGTGSLQLYCGWAGLESLSAGLL